VKDYRVVGVADVSVANAVDADAAASADAGVGIWTNLGGFGLARPRRPVVRWRSRGVMGCLPNVAHLLHAVVARYERLACVMFEPRVASRAAVIRGQAMKWRTPRR
jgi:hypothetical protein